MPSPFQKMKLSYLLCHCYKSIDIVIVCHRASRHLTKHRLNENRHQNENRRQRSLRLLTSNRLPLTNLRNVTLTNLKDVTS